MSIESDRDQSIERGLARDAMAWRESVPPAGSTCVDAETLAAWAGGALPTTQASIVESHIADCARCQEMAAAFALSEPAIAAAPVPAAMPARAPWIQRWWLPLAGGAVAATLVIVSIARRGDVAPPPIAPSSIDASATTPSGVAGAVGPPPSAKAPESTTARSETTPPAVEQRIGPAPKTAKTPDGRPAGSVSVQGGTSAAQTVAIPRPAPAAAPPPPPQAAPPVAAPVLTAPSQLPATALPGVPVIPSPKPLTLQPPQARNLQDMRAEASATMSFDRLSPVVEFASPSAISAAGGRGGGGAAGGGGRLNVASNIVTRWRFTRLSSTLERSMDNGVTWETTDLSATPIAIIAGAAPSRLTCWLIGKGGVVLRSTDGVTFSRVSFPESIDLVAIVAADLLNITVTAAGGRQFTTTDGGITWREKK